MLELEKPLFEGQVQGWIASTFINERPLRGISGILDWRFLGAISAQVKHGFITGKAGECAYFPMTRHGATYHFFFVGGGFAPELGARAPISQDSLKTLSKNLAALKIPKLGVSLSDFGHTKRDVFANHLQGVSLWIIP